MTDFDVWRVIGNWAASGGECGCDIVPAHHDTGSQSSKRTLEWKTRPKFWPMMEHAYIYKLPVKIINDNVLAPHGWIFNQQVVDTRDFIEGLKERVMEHINLFFCDQSLNADWLYRNVKNEFEMNQHPAKAKEELKPPTRDEATCLTCHGHNYITVGSNVPGNYGSHSAPCPTCNTSLKLKETVASLTNVMKPEPKVPWCLVREAKMLSDIVGGYLSDFDFKKKWPDEYRGPTYQAAVVNGIVDPLIKQHGLSGNDVTPNIASPRLRMPSEVLVTIIDSLLDMQEGEEARKKVAKRAHKWLEANVTSANPEEEKK